MQGRAETSLYTALALLAFAANSILARLALRSGDVDPSSFTAVRLMAGAVTLALLIRGRATTGRREAGRGAAGPIALFTYAAAFSFAYVRIGVATGALLAFGAVQLTMVGWAMTRGERPPARVWLGAALAAAGLCWLMVPKLERPDPLGSVLMILAGVAWGAYSLAGGRATDALASNARSFLWSVPLALLLEASSARAVTVSGRGIVLAAVSGGITSGLGYAIWYRALRGLTATQAAFLQLSVPIIAAIASVAILGETPSPHLLASAAAVLGGLALVVSRRRR